MKLAIFDIDGTLIQNPGKEFCGRDFTWDKFINESTNLPPIHSVVTWTKQLYLLGYYIIMTTARPERYREITLKQITDVFGSDMVCSVMLRDDSICDKEHNEIIKMYEENTPDSVIQDILRHRHADNRISVLNTIKNGFLVKNLSEAIVFDNQKENLNVFVEEMADCWLVLPDGEIVEYGVKNT